MNRFLIFCCLIFLLACKKHQESIGYQPSPILVFDVLVGNGEVFDGLIQVRKITNPGADIIINSWGELVWVKRADTALYRPFTPSNGRYLSLFSDERLYELSYSGDTLMNASYGTAGFDRRLHHDLAYDEDNILALTKEIIYLDLSSVGGSETDSVVTDGILSLDRDGNQTWRWKLDDVLDPMDDPDILKAKKDWGHANSLAVDTDGHYLISWRDFNEVWKLDKNTGEVIWKYGHHNVKDEDEMFYGQHSFHSTGEGSYILFDNGNKKLRASSRALGFSYNSSVGFSQDLSVYLPDSLFTSKQGSVYKMDEEKFLFSSSMSSSLVVTNRNGEILWYAKGTEPYYRAYYLEDQRF